LNTSKRVGLCLVLVAIGCRTAGGDGDAAASAATTAPVREAAVALSRPGLPNAYRVSADLYRGAQPEPAGFRELERLGIRTIVNLRLAHSDEDLIQQSGVRPGALQYRPIPTGAWDADEDEVREFLRIVVDPKLRPVFVHCQHGSDRTGTMVAAYRVVVQGWSKPEAVDEMRGGPFGFHEVFANLPRFLREMDVAKLRADLGLARP
jgi:protein tyrosine/serine phosphatase